MIYSVYDIKIGVGYDIHHILYDLIQGQGIVYRVYCRPRVRGHGMLYMRYTIHPEVWGSQGMRRRLLRAGGVGSAACCTC